MNTLSKTIAITTLLAATSAVANPYYSADREARGMEQHTRCYVSMSDWMDNGVEGHIMGESMHLCARGKSPVYTETQPDPSK
jgi:hypothetical protein